MPLFALAGDSCGRCLAEKRAVASCCSLCLQDREGPHPCLRTAAIPRFVGAGAVTPIRTVLGLSRVQLPEWLCLKSNLLSWDGWDYSHSLVPTMALQPLEIKTGLSLEHESCTGAAEAPSSLLREL